MKIKTQIKKHAPTALVVGGIATIIGGTVLACRKTVKMKKVVDDTKEDIEEIQAALSSVNPEDPDYTEKDCKKDVRKVYVRAAVSTAKTYAIPAGIIFAGSAMVLCGHNILRKRYSALSAAYVTLSSGFEAYRARVRDKIGEDEEYKLYHNIETEVMGDGKKKKKEDTINNLSMYDIILTPSRSEYLKGHGYNEETGEWDDHIFTIIKSTFNTVNGRTQNSKRFVPVNEIRQDLGVDPISDGYMVGFAPDTPIGFKIYKGKDPVTGEPAIIIAIEPNAHTVDCLPKNDYSK